MYSEKFVTLVTSNVRQYSHSYWAPNSMCTKCNTHSLIHIFKIIKSWNTQNTSNFYASHKLNMTTQVYRLYRWDFEHRKCLNPTKNHTSKYSLFPSAIIYCPVQEVYIPRFITHHGLHILHINFWLRVKILIFNRILNNKQVFNLFSKWFLQNFHQHLNFL